MNRQQYDNQVNAIVNIAAEITRLRKLGGQDALADELTALMVKLGRELPAQRPEA